MIELYEIWIFYAVLGIGAGLLAGMLGVGGGQVIGPGLLFIFHAFNFPEEHLVHMALGTSLAVIIVTSISSAYSHYKLGSVDLSILKRMVIGIICGSVIGGLVAGYLPSQTLRLCFGVFLILLALQMISAWKPTPERELPSRGKLTSISALIGFLSSIVGVGGGSMVVPYLSWNNIDIKKSIGTAAACGTPLAMAGMIGYVFSAYGKSGIPNYSVGYVYLPAFFMVSLLSIFFTSIGAKITNILPMAILKRVFAVFLLIAGIRILL